MILRGFLRFDVTRYVKLQQYEDCVGEIYNGRDFQICPENLKYRDLIFLWIWKRNPHTAINYDQFSSEVYKIFDVKKWLNMNSKPDNKCENSDDIILLSEIITNSR